MSQCEYVWVFKGKKSDFPSAIFKKFEDANKWIKENQLDGILTQYPLDICVYDWSIQSNFFKPTKTHEFSNKFKQNFSCAAQKHHHYEKGETE